MKRRLLLAPLALAAARAGLAGQPRSADLLRIQSFALVALGAPPAPVAAARDAWLAHRPPDAGPGFKARCSKSVPGCANERNRARPRASPPDHAA
jgi:hypothetical protein